MEQGEQIRGWTILSDNRQCAQKAIARASRYGVNHFQLSHHIVHKLKHLRERGTRELVNSLTDEAHGCGIDEVVLWDHALYWLGYYPDRFRTGPEGALDLDSAELWGWIKDDYRALLDMAPDADGIVLTFIETGARVERQYSKAHPSAQEKLALLINNLAELIIGERGLRFYIRTFIYFPSELDPMLKCLRLIRNKDIIVMCKEVPHDFILTHPDNFWIKEVPFPVVVEFDCAHEFNGQGVVASVFPEVHRRRWRHYRSLPNVIGHTARIDRYGSSLIIDTPSEANLFALKAPLEGSEPPAERIYEDFIAEKYGEHLVPYLRPALQSAYDVITSVYYTFGLPTNTHSRLRFDDTWSYAGLVSSRWKSEPSVHVAHGVNRTFHCWADIVNRLAPPEVKGDQGYLGREILWDKIARGWIDVEERMDLEYLRYLIIEKEYGIELAARSMKAVEEGRSVASGATYERLYHTFARTVLSARLFRAAAMVYYGARVYGRGEAHRTPELISVVREGIADVESVGQKIMAYPAKGPQAWYRWHEDVTTARTYATRARQLLSEN